jgi:hypothetical protein
MPSLEPVGSLEASPYKLAKRAGWLLVAAVELQKP